MSRFYGCAARPPIQKSAEFASPAHQLRMAVREALCRLDTASLLRNVQNALFHSRVLRAIEYVAREKEIIGPLVPLSAATYDGELGF